MRRAAAGFFLAALFVLPLYPKIGLIGVPGTYIPVRFDDLAIALTGLVWLLSLWAERRLPMLPRLVAGATVAWLLATLTGLAVGALVLHSISPLTGLAYWAKPIEYLLLGAIAYDLVLAGAVSPRLVLGTILASASLVVGYALFERVGILPHLPGVTPPPGVATSTFGDYHELAGYLGIIIILVVALRAQASGAPLRWSALVAVAACSMALYFTAVRSEYLALAAALVLIATWRPARLPALVGVTALGVLFVSPLITGAVNSVLSGQPPPSTPGTPTADVNVTTRYTDSTFTSSWNERFNVKWPAFLAAGMRSPIVGLGPSAATEAADGYYMRMFVEAGVVGLAAFVALLGAIVLSLWRAARAATGVACNLAVALLVATLFLAAVGVLIDIWVASRVMELYWPLLGTTLAAAAVSGTFASRRHPMAEAGPAMRTSDPGPAS